MPQLDFWAMGCLAARAFTRHPLFHGNDRDEVFDSKECDTIANWDLADLERTAEDVEARLKKYDRSCDKNLPWSHWAQDLLMWLLQPQLTNRPKSTDEILGHKFIAGQGGSLQMSRLHDAGVLNNNLPLYSRRSGCFALHRK